MGPLRDRLRQLLTSCLKAGWCPPVWKRAKLVLRKDERPADSPSAYRPICLLDEVGKLFERVLAARLRSLLSGIGPDLAECQYGFWEGRSTVDAIRHVESFSARVTSRGEKLIAVSLDIKNAFNSLPMG